MKTTFVGIVLAVLAALVLVPQAHAWQQTTHRQVIDIGKGLVIKGDLVLVINNKQLSNNGTSVNMTNMFEHHVTANGTSVFTAQNGTNFIPVPGPQGKQGPQGIPGQQGIQGVQGPAGKNSTTTICVMTGQNICPVPRGALVFNATTHP